MTATKNQRKTRGNMKSKFNPYDSDQSENGEEYVSHGSSFDNVPIYKDTMDECDGQESLR